MGEYHYMGYKVTIGTSDSLWAFKCTKCGHKKYSMFRQLTNPAHVCPNKEEKTHEYSIGTQDSVSGAESNSNAEGDI